MFMIRKVKERKKCFKSKGRIQIRLRNWEVQEKH
jgi:hypothetical protein